MKRLESPADPEAVEGMARFGVNPANTLDISLPTLRKMAKDTGKDHALAGGLWNTNIREIDRA